MGGRVHAVVKLPKDELPATLTWQAGDLGGSFTVDKKTQKKLTIPIDPRGIGPVDKKTEVKVQKKSEKTGTPQPTVVK
jgi:hypothetical protein